MAKTTGIAWTRSTFNPWIGCTEVSPGCDACYARTLDARHRWGGATHWGAGVPRMRTSESYWRQPLRWDKLAEEELVTGSPRGSWEGRLGFWPVFPSLCDPFDNEVPAVLHQHFWELIRSTPALTWLLLTKRIGNARKIIPWASTEQPWPNVWIGASVVNQEEADRDIPKLLDTRAAKRFVSYEPALGPVDFSPWLAPKFNACQMGNASHERILAVVKAAAKAEFGWVGIDQIIVGGESNQGKHKARPFKIEWARDVRGQCRAAGVAFFMKQTGSDHALLYERVQKDRAGADPSEWPEDLRVQEFPA